MIVAPAFLEGFEPGDKDNICTPIELFLTLEEQFGTFEIDLFANPGNALCADYYTIEDPPTIYNVPKNSRCFANPPYSRGNIDEAMETIHKLYRMRNCRIVALVRADPSTRWWQNHVDEIAFQVLLLTNRVVFRGRTGGYDFPSAVLVYEPNLNPFRTDYSCWNWKE